MITISIVLYNHSFEEIEQLITPFLKHEIIRNIYLIDNSETSNTRFSTLPINYIYTGSNLGYGKAHNIAIKKSIEQNTKYHIVLNPDIESGIEVLLGLLDYMESHSEVGLCMPNIVYPDYQRQYLCKLLPTPFDLIFRRFIPTRHLKKYHENKFELKKANYNCDFYAPSLSGCFMFMRTSILQRINGFDERFFMYCEDLDLCRRINHFSDLRYVPSDPVIHHYTKGSYKISKLLIYHIKSAIQYFNKWGWFLDNERKIINKKALSQFK